MSFDDIDEKLMDAQEKEPETVDFLVTVKIYPGDLEIESLIKEVESRLADVASFTNYVRNAKSVLINVREIER